MPAQLGQHRLGQGTDAELERCAVGDQGGDPPGHGPHVVGDVRGGHLPDRAGVEKAVVHCSGESVRAPGVCGTRSLTSAITTRAVSMAAEK